MKITLGDIRGMVEECVKRVIFEQFNRNDIYNYTWVFYNDKEYDPSKVTGIQYDDPLHVMRNKPFGGLWASPVDSKLSWKKWCEDEKFHLEKLQVPFMFKISRDAKIYVIDDFEDLKKVSLKKSAYIKNMLYIDYKLLEILGFDGIFVTANAASSLKCLPLPYEGLGSWDCESICIFNKNIVIPIN